MANALRKHMLNVATDRVALDAQYGNATSRRVILNALKRAGATHSQAKDILKSITAAPDQIVPTNQLWLWHVGNGMYELAVEGQSLNDITKNGEMNDA